MQNLIALALLAFGGYSFYSGSSGMTPTELMKAISAIGASGYFAYSGNKDNILSLFTRISSNGAKKADDESVFEPKDYEIMDLNCLIHLRNRVIEAGSQEGLETCAKLNDIVFSLNKTAKQKTSVDLAVKKV